MDVDVTQEELLSQAGALLQEGQYAESSFACLSPLQRIVFKHLVDLSGRDRPIQRIGREGWLALMRDLDQAGIKMNEELSGKAAQVLSSVRAKRVTVNDWQSAYSSKAVVVLDDAKRRILSREITLFLHNVASGVERFTQLVGKTVELHE